MRFEISFQVRIIPDTEDRQEALEEAADFKQMIRESSYSIVSFGPSVTIIEFDEEGMEL